MDEGFIDAERKRLDAEYLSAIPGYGKVIPVKLKKAFQEDIKKFDVLLKSYANAIAGEITKHLEGEMAKLTEELLPRFLKNRPKDFKKTQLFDEMNDDAARCYIANALGSASQKIERPSRQS